MWLDSTSTYMRAGLSMFDVDRFDFFVTACNHLVGAGLRRGDIPRLALALALVSAVRQLFVTVIARRICSVLFTVCTTTYDFPIRLSIITVLNVTECPKTIVSGRLDLDCLQTLLGPIPTLNGCC